MLLYFIVIAFKSSVSPLNTALWGQRAWLPRSPASLASAYLVNEASAPYLPLRASRSVLSPRYCGRKPEVYHAAGACLGSSLQTRLWQDSEPRTGLQSPSAESPATLCHGCGPGSSCCSGWCVSWHVTVRTGRLSVQTEVSVEIWEWKLDCLWYFSLKCLSAVDENITQTAPRCRKEHLEREKPFLLKSSIRSQQKVDEWQVICCSGAQNCKEMPLALCVFFTGSHVPFICGSLSLECTLKAKLPPESQQEMLWRLCVC